MIQTNALFMIAKNHQNSLLLTGITFPRINRLSREVLLRQTQKANLTKAQLFQSKKQQKKKMMIVLLKTVGRNARNQQINPHPQAKIDQIQNKIYSEIIWNSY